MGRVRGSPIANRRPYDRPNVFIVRRTNGENFMIINMKFPWPQRGLGTNKYYIDLLGFIASTHAARDGGLRQSHAVSASHHDNDAKQIPPSTLERTRVGSFARCAFFLRMILSENRFPLFRDHAFCLRMIFFRKPVPFRDHAFCLRMILSENRFPLFGIMLKHPAARSP